MYSASHAFHIQFTALKNNKVSEKKPQHEELIAKKSPNYRSTEQIHTENWSTGVLQAW